MSRADFWARRKAAVAKEAEVELAAVQAAEEAQAEADLAERTDADLLAEAKQPAPEELESAEAVREFMNSALPQRLKTRALRQLWRLNPVLANLDGLVDYGEDFTDSATVIENLQTAYQVGKGMLAHIEAMAKAEEESVETEEAVPAEDDDAAPDADPDPPVLVAADEVLPETPDSASLAYTAEQIDTSEDGPHPVALSRRRMQFHFQEPA